MDEKIENLSCISCTIKGEFRNYKGKKPFIMYFRENEFFLHEADTEYNVHITVRNLIKEIGPAEKVV